MSELNRYENNVFEGPARLAMYGKDAMQEWRTYDYYRMECELPEVGLYTYHSLSIAKQWHTSYFKYLYNRVGAKYEWFYGNFQTDHDLQRYLNTFYRHYVTLMLGGKPIGFAILTKVDKECNLSYFGIFPEYTGFGLGRKMLLECMQYATDIGCDKMWLYTTSNDHPGALSLYRKVGFSVVEKKTVSEYFPVRDE